MAPHARQCSWIWRQVRTRASFFLHVGHSTASSFWVEALRGSPSYASTIIGFESGGNRENRRIWLVVNGSFLAAGTGGSLIPSMGMLIFEWLHESSRFLALILAGRV